MPHANRDEEPRSGKEALTEHDVNELRQQIEAELEKVRERISALENAIQRASTSSDLASPNLESRQHAVTFTAVDHSTGWKPRRNAVAWLEITPAVYVESLSWLRNYVAANPNAATQVVALASASELSPAMLIALNTSGVLVYDKPQGFASFSDNAKEAYVVTNLESFFESYFGLTPRVKLDARESVDYIQSPFRLSRADGERFWRRLTTDEE